VSLTRHQQDRSVGLRLLSTFLTPHLNTIARIIYKWANLLKESNSSISSFNGIICKYIFNRHKRHGVKNKWTNGNFNCYLRFWVVRDLFCKVEHKFSLYLHLKRCSIIHNKNSHEVGDLRQHKRNWIIYLVNKTRQGKNYKQHCTSSSCWMKKLSVFAITRNSDSVNVANFRWLGVHWFQSLESFGK